MPIDLTFFSEKGERFWVVVNGVKQNEKATQNVKVLDQKGTSWKIQIVFENENLLEANKTIHLPQQPNTNEAELTYQIKKNRKGIYQVRLFSYVGFPNPVTELIKDTFDNRWRKTNNNPPPNFPQVQNFPNNPNNPNNNGVFNSGNLNCNMQLDEHTFSDLTQSIINQNMEDTKQNVAKQGIGKFCVTTSQVRQIMGIFNFEESKLEFAKWAYDRTSDRENYFRVNDVFNFSISVDELQSYIKSKN